MKMRPLVGSISRLIMRRVVVLPQPEGPTSTQISPSGTSRVRWSTATAPDSYCLVTPSRRIIGLFLSPRREGWLALRDQKATVSVNLPIDVDRTPKTSRAVGVADGAPGRTLREETGMRSDGRSRAGSATRRGSSVAQLPGALRWLR